MHSAVSGGDGGGGGEGGKKHRVPQSSQSVPMSQLSLADPGPPSSHRAPFKWGEHVFSHMQPAGMEGGGRGGVEGEGGDDGGDEGEGGDDGDGEKHRVPQSSQSVPMSQLSPADPGPPSSHKAPFIGGEHVFSHMQPDSLSRLPDAGGAGSNSIVTTVELESCQYSLHMFSHSAMVL
ncbi:MAG: hypothetical protein CBC12_05475 [Candidatus Puniceispirillum sp. TMED52]|nr:MAG: hypothetical protein CBC12_05475 [Candidatus Puniceispirillum sp. TMED52]